MQFRSIASSSAGCAYLVTAAGIAPLLIDCGVSVDAIREATGFKSTGLAGCLVSHAHGDHSKSAMKLAKAGIEIYGSQETLKSVELLGHHRGNVLKPFEPKPLFPSGYFNSDQTPVQPGRPYWTVMGFELVHDCPGTFGFLVSAGGETLLYMTDTAYSPHTFPGVNYYAVEANYDPEIMRANTEKGVIDSQRFVRTVRNHMSIDTLVAMLKKNDIGCAKHVYLLHLSDSNSDEAAFKEKVQRATGVPVTVCPKGVVA